MTRRLSLAVPKNLLLPVVLMSCTLVSAEEPRDPIPRGGGRLKNHWATCVSA